MNISGFAYVYKNRQNLKRGGVGILIRNDISFKQREDLSTFVEGEFETIFIETTSKEKQAVLGDIYRAPNTNQEVSLNRLNDILSKLELENKQVMI